MGIDRKSPDRVLKLLNRMDNASTNLFDILGIEDDEKDHTKLLVWLLNPGAGHGIGTDLLTAFLEEAGVRAGLDGRDVEVLPFWREPNETEIDIAIITDSTLFAVEIKTTHHLEQSQYERQTEALDDITDQDDYPSEFRYIYLTHDSTNYPSFVSHRLEWQDVIELVGEHLAAVEDDADITRLREWCRCLQQDVINEFSFNPETELALRYPDYVERFEIEVDKTRIDADRKWLFNEYQQWFSQQYQIVSDEIPTGWDGRITSDFRRGTKVIRIHKPQWNTENTGLRFEVLAKEPRMRSGDNHDGDSSAYRTLEPHIELTLTYSKADRQERQELYDVLSPGGHQTLTDAGFVRIQDALPETADADINPHHVYSKQVPLDFENPDQTLSGLKRGTETLVEVEPILTDYITGRQ